MYAKLTSILLIGMLLTTTVLQTVHAQTTVDNTYYEYDDAGRLMSVSYDSTVFIRYAFDAAGNMVGRQVERSSGTASTPDALLPRAFRLHPNYPNPFNPETRFRYELPEAVSVRLTVFNVLGQAVQTLVDERKPPGIHAVRWDGRDFGGKELASGLYFYRLEAGSFVKTRRMTLVR